MYRKSEESRPNVYQIVTDRVVSLIERGTVPWKQPWTGVPPTNYDSGKQYKGINILTLAAFGRDYDSPYWLTYNQARKHGGYIRKGEHGVPVVWKEKVVREEEDSRGEKALSVRWYLKYYTVFNLRQVEGVPNKDPFPNTIKAGDAAVEACESVLAGMAGRPRELVNRRASYAPCEDIVRMPPLRSFHTAEGYVSTRFHEYVHSTAAPNRCGRYRPWPPADSFGDHDYSFEELIAEMGAAYLCAQLGIDNSGFEDELEQSASYLKGWLRPLKDDKTFLMRASGKARQAVEYILVGKVPSRAESAPAKVCGEVTA